MGNITAAEATMVETACENYIRAKDFHPLAELKAHTIIIRMVERNPKLSPYAEAYLRHSNEFEDWKKSRN